ncbi:MAG: 16S rRNA (guanine(527)-N(7))-methyltransferase RsmG, partial [Oscillospiraceae bacterium]
MIFEKNEFLKLFSDDGIEVSDEQYDKFLNYSKLLVEWNEKINLTAITDSYGISVKHLLDSVLPLRLTDIPTNSRLIDVGTGAGFPAVPIKIIRPDIKLTLLDSLSKRVNFLKTVCGALSLDAECFHARAEDAGRNKDFR